MVRASFPSAWTLGWRALAILGLLGAPVLQGATPLHRDVLVFVPAYEASQLYDSNLDADTAAPVCVWGNYNTFLSSRRYFALRMPNPLEAKPLLAVGPVDVYRRFVSALTERSDDRPGFVPYTLGADFFIYTYDWRQEIASVSAPQLGQALAQYARIHAGKTGLPAAKTRFIIVTHSMGGLVARTLLSEKPELASRVAGLYLVGCPNAGCVKAIRTVVVGPDSLKEHAHGFPGALLDIIPTDVDQNVTKLVGITRPSLYELLPWDQPRWERRAADGEAQTMKGADVLKLSSWTGYWPSAALERRFFLNSWLKDRQAEGRKKINPPDWEFCQDPGEMKLKTLLSETARWRAMVGPLSRTDHQMTAPGGSSRLHIILSTGVPTPTGVVTLGEHDSSQGYYIYDPPNTGDGTMEAKRVLGDLPDSAPNITHLRNVAHGRLMIDPQFIRYFVTELSREQSADDPQ